MDDSIIPHLAIYIADRARGERGSNIDSGRIAQWLREFNVTERAPADLYVQQFGRAARPEPPKGTDLHPLLPYARAVADKLRETWHWHTFSDEMILPVLETGKPGDPPAREMAERLLRKLQLGESLFGPITDALRARGWDGVVSMPADMLVNGLIATHDVLPPHDARRLRLEAFAMRAPASLLPVFFDSTAGVAPTDQNCRHAYAAAAWAWAQAMIDAEPKS